MEQMSEMSQDSLADAKREMNKTVIVNPGESAKLDCPIPSELFGTKVSWIRRRDFQLLSVGDAVYSTDHRFFVSHSRHSHYQGSRHSQVWFLHIRNATENDEGEYECQTSNHPRVSTIIYLKVQNALSVIIGPAERVVAGGSELNLICSFQNSSKDLSYVFWYQGNKMINYDLVRGVVVTTGKSISTLKIASTNSSHSGNYTCEPSNAAPSSVFVHVTEDDSSIGNFHQKSIEGGVSGNNVDMSGAADPARSGSAVEGDSTETKTPVRQLGVKSASSTSPKSISESGFPPFLTLGLHIIIFSQIFIH